MMGSILLLLTLLGQNTCKAGDTAYVQGYLMESSCAALQYSATTVRVRHARECLKHTSSKMANFAILEPQGQHKLWHIDASANNELARHFGLLQDQSNITVAVWGSIRKDPAKGETITACAISLLSESGK
jgi:hypothetical protein